MKSKKKIKLTKIEDPTPTATQLANDYSTLIVNLFNTIEQTRLYKEWDDKFCRIEVTTEFDKIKQFISANTDFQKFSKEDLEFLGFSEWDEDENGYLMLIPLWAWDCIPDGTIVYSINGRKLIKGKDFVSMDTRYGCLAYGIYVKE